MPPTRILAVCLGNICRSPLAEALLRREAERRDLNWEVDSAGTAGYHNGKPPDPRGVAEAAKHGLDTTGQRSRQVTPADLHRFDLVLAMDRQNYRDLQAMATNGEQKNKIHLLLEYTNLEKEVGPDVFDPYYDDDAYTGVFQLLERAAKRVADRIENDQL